ncbi:unnamed protein product [Strongylus vulgaris]|uniref:Uncharacterized protein n=1 Tax=Strongylus vulgaris TaxID=40348 RepID=A0A3P7JIK1_STRVU|nr:unnamed protein product [Strongylus vulgaris]
MRFHQGGDSQQVFVEAQSRCYRRHYNGRILLIHCDERSDGGAERKASIAPFSHGNLI